MNKFLNYKYWFNSRPEPLWPANDKLIMSIYGAILVAAIVFFFLKRKNGQDPYRKTWASLFTLCVTNLAIGLVLLFFSFELVPFLAARFWLALWLIEAGVWLGFIIRGALKVPAVIAKQEEEKKYKQYIP